MTYLRRHCYDDAGFLAAQLVELAAVYRQDSIAWALAETEMLIPG